MNVKINFISPASHVEIIPKPFDPRIQCIHIPINRFDKFKERCSDTSICTPGEEHIAIFDTFVAEEKFGWQFAQIFPKGTRILDTQDLHFLRLSRMRQLKNTTYVGKDDLNYILRLPCFTSDENRQDVIRELSSIHRSDCTAMVSTFEMSLLQKEFNVHQDKLFLSTFFFSQQVIEENQRTCLSWRERKNIICIGSFLHPGNKDCFEYLRNYLWPKLKPLLPSGTELHIFGSHCSSHHHSDLRRGFIVKGFFEGDAAKLVGKYRLLLAPLRFGAGIKGKNCTAWSAGTPVSTTSIGIEAMEDGINPWGGVCADTEDDLLRETVELYSNQGKWKECSKAGFRLLKSRFCKEFNGPALWKHIWKAHKNTSSRRLSDWNFQMLNWHKHRSHEYMSKFIALKESKQI